MHTDGISTTKIGTGIDPMQPINPIIARALQSNIEHGYQRFIKLVSESRGMTLEEVDEIAQGRVWAGETALKIGLIDNLGNMEDAVKRAADLADLEDYKTFYPSLPLEWTDQILKQFFSKVVGIFGSRAGSKDLIKRSVELANDLETYNDPKGIYLKCLDCLIY